MARLARRDSRSSTFTGASTDNRTAASSVDLDATSSTTASSSSELPSPPVASSDPSTRASPCYDEQGQELPPGWRVPTSPPSPPAHSYHETPSPLVERQTRRLKQEELRGKLSDTQTSRNETAARSSHDGPQHFPSVHTASSYLRRSPSLFVEPSQQQLQQSTSTLPHASSALQFLRPINLLTRRTRHEKTTLPSHFSPQPFISSRESRMDSGVREATQQPRFAKLSRLRDPGSGGKRKVKIPYRHAHKRSYSVQWQQMDRWQTNSTARLRDLVVLIFFLCGAAVVIFQVCLVKTSSSRARRAGSSSKMRETYGTHHLRHFEEPQRDTVVLYRILGNDLPPRHGEGQTLRNLRFMLSHENDFDFLSSPTSSYGLRVEKYYVLNRLTSRSAVDSLLAVFDEHGIARDRVLTIPFRWEEYSKKGLRWDSGVTGCDNRWNVHGVGQCVDDPSPDSAQLAPSTSIQDAEKQKRWETMAKLRAMEYSLHDKNLYAINNNGGRNFALEHGRSLPHARWILPLDGNCFFTPKSMTAIFQSLLENGEGEHPKRHVVIPMVRLLDNGDIVNKNRPPIDATSGYDPMRLDIAAVEAPEEPQIGFRWDTKVSYQPAMRYGRRSKLELLWRLGAIPFTRNLHTKQLPWEFADKTFLTAESYNSVNADRKHSTGSSHFTAGWVNRLFSGERSQEESTPRAAELRRVNRMRGIVAYLERLDERLTRGLEGCETPGTCGFNKHNLWHWNAHDLATLRRSARLEDPTAIERIQRFEDNAQNVLIAAQQRKRRLDEHAWSLLLPEMVEHDAARLALAGYVTSNLTYSSAAADLIRLRFLVNPKTPNVQRHDYGELKTAEDASGYAFPPSFRADPSLWSNAGLSDPSELRYDPFDFDPSLLLDTLRLLSPSYQPKLHLASILPLHKLHSLFSHHLRTLLLSSKGTQLSRSPPSWEAAFRYDTQVAALAAYLDDARLLARVGKRHELRFLNATSGERMSEGGTKGTLPHQKDGEIHLRLGLLNLGYARRSNGAAVPTLDPLFVL